MNLKSKTKIIPKNRITNVVIYNYGDKGRLKCILDMIVGHIPSFIGIYEYDFMMPGYRVIQNAIGIDNTNMKNIYSSNQDMQLAVQYLSHVINKTDNKIVKELYDVIKRILTQCLDYDDTDDNSNKVVNIITVDDYCKYNEINDMLKGFRSHGMVNIPIDTDGYNYDIEDQSKIIEFIKKKLGGEFDWEQ